MEAFPCAMAQLYTTMELVPVPLVPTCATKWVYKAVKIYFACSYFLALFLINP